MDNNLDGKNICESETTGNNDMRGTNKRHGSHKKKQPLILEVPGGAKEVLLHTCCAPCSSAIIECMLNNGIRPTIFYCNPNIYPEEEYIIRKNECIRYATDLGLSFIDADYDYGNWRSTMCGLEDEPER